MESPAGEPTEAAERPRRAELLDTLRRFQAEARRGMRVQKVFLMVAAPPALIVAAIRMLQDPGGHGKTGWPMPLGLLVAAYWALDSFLFRGWRRRFKKEILAPLAADVHPELRYEPEGTIPQPVFESSGLFALSPNYFRGEDLVTGRVGETEIQCCDMRAARFRKRILFGLVPKLDMLLATQSDLEWILKGLFVVAEFNKAFSGTTLVLPESPPPQSGFAHAARRHGGAALERVGLEDPEFERQFRVLASDQVEARYLLSTSFMQRLLDYRRRAQAPFAVAFSSARLFLAFPGSRDRLEPPSPARFLRRYGEEIDAGRSPWELSDYLKELSFGIELTEELKLNTRIWSRDSGGTP